MGDRTPITDRGAEGRVTGYGDRAVAQGDAAARPPAGTTATPGSTAGAATAAAPPLVATVTLYDPKSRLKGSVRAAVVARLERDLNALRASKLGADFLQKKLGIRFEVRHVARISARDERFTTGRLDFPVYILNGHTSDATPAKEIRELMLDHGVIDSGVARSQFEDAHDGWKDANVEGLGIQPLQGFKKVGFIKGDNVAKLAKDVESGFTNVIKHELGHMCNIKVHASSGVMRSGIQLAAGSFDYTDANQQSILVKLAELATVSAVELQRRYERANM